jgi:hypothetical protein
VLSVQDGGESACLSCDSVLGRPGQGDDWTSASALYMNQFNNMYTMFLDSVGISTVLLQPFPH